jgi:hypothetical protein
LFRPAQFTVVNVVKAQTVVGSENSDDRAIGSASATHREAKKMYRQANYLIC